MTTNYEPIIKICAKCQKITYFCNCNFGWYRWQAVYNNIFELIKDQFLRLLNLR